MPVRVTSEPSDDDVALARLAAVIEQMTAEEYRHYTANLPQAMIHTIERAVAKHAGEGWRANPLTMALHFGTMDDLAHSRLLAEKFKDAVEGRSTRQLWHLPPQHGKSEVASRHGPAWALDADPTLRLALTSYADELADSNAVWIRDFLIEHGDELRARLRKDRRRQDRFVTEAGGGLMSTGVGGSLTGFSQHGVIVDDPFKGWEEAHSKANRDKVWRWFLTTVRTRLNRRRGIPGFIIVVMTRWHEEDLAGKLVSEMENGNGEEYEIVRLTAIAEKHDPKSKDAFARLPDPLKRKLGEPLAPTLHPLEDLQAIMNQFGSYLSAGLYQQRPAPEEGGEIKRAWFQYAETFPPRYDATLTSWDMKMKDKSGGDYVVGGAWGRTGSQFWMIDMLRGQWNVVRTKVAIALMQVRHPYITRHIIENTGNGPEIMAELRAGDKEFVLSAEVRGDMGITDDEAEKVQTLIRSGIPGLIPQNVKYDKVVRMRAQSGIIEAGNVTLPEGKDYTNVLVDECAAFPTAGVHDDCVDMLSQALKRLRIATAQPPSNAQRQVGKPKAGARATSRGGTIGRARMRGR